MKKHHLNKRDFRTRHPSIIRVKITHTDTSTAALCRARTLVNHGVGSRNSKFAHAAVGTVLLFLQVSHRQQVLLAPVTIGTSPEPPPAHKSSELADNSPIQ